MTTEAQIAAKTQAEAALGNAIGNYPMPQRLKTWDELTDAERVQTLRAEVRGLYTLLSYLQRSVSTLEAHGHDGNGQITVPLFRLHGAQDNCGRYDPLA